MPVELFINKVDFDFDFDIDFDIDCDIDFDSRACMFESGAHFDLSNNLPV
jgi:hypothetical protein